MKRLGLVVLLAVLLLALLATPVFAGGGQDQAQRGPAQSQGVGGFDEWGYNYTASLYNGTYDGYNKVLGDADPAYADQKLNMNWDREYDAVRFDGEGTWDGDESLTNHYVGRDAAHAKEVGHVKIIGVGSDLQNSDAWREGGVALWGAFEEIQVVLSGQGTSTIDLKTEPAGMGNGLGK